MQLLKDKRIRTPHILIAILLLATVLRFWNFSSRLSIGSDSGRDAFVAAYGAKALQLPLTGPFSSLGQFTFGPWYYYELIAADLLGGNPFAPWILSNLVSIAVCYLMFLLGRKLVNAEVGLLMASLTAIAPAQLSAAMGLTNPNFISFFATSSLLVFLSLLTPNKKSEQRNAWILGIFLGLGVNHHYQMAGMLILPLLLIFRPGAVRLIVKAYFGVALTFLPLLLFDLNNHWYTLRHLSETYLYGQGRIYVPNRWLFYLRDFWPQFWGYVFGVSQYVSVVIIIAASVIAFRKILKRRLTPTWIALGVLFGIEFFMLRYYWGERFMGYLQYLHPFVILATAIVLWQSTRLPFGRLVYPVLVMIFAGLMFKTALRELRPSEFTVEIFHRADVLEQLYPSPSGYRVYSCRRSGWDYTQALAYVLYARGKLSAKGVPIGIPPGCVMPLYNVPASATEAERAAISQSLYPTIAGYDAVILKEASPAALQAAHYSEVSPESIYESTVRWWFREAP